jgi:hypothetical protein
LFYAVIACWKVVVTQLHVVPDREYFRVALDWGNDQPTVNDSQETEQFLELLFVAMGGNSSIEPEDGCSSN